MALFGRKLRMLLALPLLLTAVAGCEGKHSWHSVLGQTVIDWIDFVKWKDRTYEGMYAAVLADPSGVGEPVGKVRFMLEGHVDNPSYASKNGDAAFLPKGTALYAIKGDAGVLSWRSPTRRPFTATGYTSTGTSGEITRNRSTTCPPTRSIASSCTGIRRAKRRLC